MNILIIMGGFFPGTKYGGPPVSVDNFCSLMKDCNCYIVTHNHDMGEKITYKDIKEGWNDKKNCKVLYLEDSKYKKAIFEQVMKTIKPDILYLQGLFQSCVLPCLQLAKKHRIPVLLAPRGELCEGALSIRRWKKIPYIHTIRLMGLVNKIHWQSTSNEETEAIKNLMKAEDKNIHYLDNVPSIPSRKYKRRTKQVGEGRFVFISRIHPKKNLLFAIRLFKKLKGKVRFDIFGPIEDAEYWNQCQIEIKQIPNNVKIEYKGLVAHDQVHEVFSQYDAFLFPTLSENYGHVIAESLAVGTPVIISDKTPWNDINRFDAGKAISLNDEDVFISYMQDIVDIGDDFLRISGSAKEFFVERSKINYLYSQYSDVLLRTR